VIANRQGSTSTTGKADSFAIVAVGASAGGLEAFTQLLRALPNNTGMAFVFIQHLDPNHPSMLSELLARASSMPVVEAKNGTIVDKNCVYVIPPNVNIAILRRRLQLTPRTAEPGQHTPIDFFMRSLAESRNSRSIGVVLSGTASDGTQGLAAIKAEGGITFAQDERSAKYDGMPHSAIASGCVDFILPPARIGQELARISGHPYLSDDLVKARTPQVKQQKNQDENFEKIFALLRNSYGINFREYKPSTIYRRTLRRMALHKTEHISDYTKFLEKHASEAETLCQDLLIHVTRFFRDLQAFEALKNKVFRAILKDKANEGTIRIWTPGCSTGEETYSLAIMLLELLGDKASRFQIQLFGTDVNERGIEKARAGVYPERISQEISQDRLRRFFTKVDAGYRVSKTVRDLCVFAKHNLAEDPPFSQMNLVTCRNLLIYLGPELQRKIVPILHYALRPSGFLMLGNAESVAAFPNLFGPADKKQKIFVKRAVRTNLHYDFSTKRYGGETSIPIAATVQDGISMVLDRQQEADRIVLKKYAPAGVVINENMEVLHFRGSIGPYIEPAPGKATLHLLKIARKEFVAELRAAVNQAKKNHAPVKRQSVEFRGNGQLKAVKISVEPLESSSDSRQYLVLFERTSPAVSPQRKAAGKFRGIGRTAKGEIGQIRRKLATAEDHLRSVIESKEASDEEYQSANEEILSANEELQSTNEELETSKEELQSANEELNTVNDELHGRNLDLDRANSDLNNLLASTSLPVVMVDRGLRLRRFTEASAKILRLLPSDIGRPITDIRSDINAPNLDELVNGVIDTLTPKETEVQDRENRWYSLQIRPYRTIDDKIDGAVLVLSDIDPLKRLNDRLRESKEFAEDILDTVREPLAVLDGHLVVVYVNPSFLKTFAMGREEIKGKSLYRLGNQQWNIPKLRAALEEVVSKAIPGLLDFEVEHDFPALGTRTMLLNARRIEDGHRGDTMILLAIEDITERRHAQRELEQSHADLETLVERRTTAVRNLSSSLLSSQDDERRRIARELHDSIGQYLASAAMSVAVLKRPDATEKETETFSLLSDILEKCSTETRTISYLLHPPLLDELGFASAAKWYVEGFSQRSGIQVNFNIPPTLKRLSVALELVLFRILQESLTNIHRHSQSRSADIRLKLDAGKITLEVTDYGQGMPPELIERFRSNDGGGVGLRSMRERISELGGRFEIQSDKNGTRIRVTAPLRRTDETRASSRSFALLADVSHALRSPLARLSVALGLAREGVRPETLEHLDRIDRETERVNKLIGQLLTMARVDSGVDLEQRKVFDLGLVVEEVAVDGDYEARSRNRAVVFNPSPECLIEGAPEMLRTAVENVVRNAVRYTAEGTDVELTMKCIRSPEGPQAVIQVRDHGPGVPEDVIAELFLPFHRLLDAVGKDGTGLGLAITECAFRIHGGSVTAANAPGGGLVVTLNVPMLDSDRGSSNSAA
jgi:two-component system CheB/CheR fusion protein